MVLLIYSRLARTAQEVYKTEDILNKDEQEQMNTWARDYKIKFTSVEDVQKAIKDKQ